MRIRILGGIFLLAPWWQVSAQVTEIEEVLVTATSRELSAQDVPVSMLTIGGELLSTQAMSRMEDLSTRLPAITIAQNPVGNHIFIRGIGTAGSNQGIEQSVSIFHDGIYMGRHQLARAPFLDVARIEVLRGPQGILFGKNTTAGAIHIITQQPTATPEGSVSALYGVHGEREVTAILSGPLTQQLNGRLAYRSYQMDGYLDNVMTDNQSPARDDDTLRVQLDWTPTAALGATLKLERSHFSNGEQTTQIRLVNPFTAGGAQLSALNQSLVAAASGNPLEAYDEQRAVINDGGLLLGQVRPELAGIPGFPDLAEGSDNTLDLITLTFDSELGDHTLLSTTGYTAYDYRDICDCDFSALPFFQVDANEEYRQRSQEFRLISPLGRRFDYIAGFYYQTSNLHYWADDAFGTRLASATAPNVARAYRFRQRQEQAALFGSLTLHLSDNTRITAGLRYTDESKAASHILNKRFTGGWDFSAATGSPAGSLAFGNTPAEYDRFVSALPTLASTLDTQLWENVLGTSEHVIEGRKRHEAFNTWSLSVEHDVHEDLLAYGTVASGTKGGGFDARFLKLANNPAFEYEEERALNLEAGIKWRLLQGAMTLNAAVFQTTVEDYQVSIFDGRSAFFVKNAAEVESSGIEMDLRWLIGSRLEASLAATWLDNQFSNFPNAPCTARNNVNDPLGCLNGADISGKPNIFSPEWAGNFNLDYFVPLGATLAASAQLNVSYTDEYMIAGDNDPMYGRQAAFTKIDLRLALASSDERWELALIGKNLGNKLTGNNNNDQPLIAGNGFSSTDRTRSIAVQATYRFNSL